MNRLTVFIFLFTTHALAFSQDYISFPTANVSWTDRDYFCDWGGGTSGMASIGTSRFWFESDTTINSIKYFNLIKNGYFFYQDCDLEFTVFSQYYEPAIAGFIRQDTALKRVYFLPVNDSIEKLLYDFNLIVGDTISPEALLNPPIIVSRIRVSQVDTFYSERDYRRLYLELYDSSSNVWRQGNQWIEGIGSINGLLYPAFNHYWMGAGGQDLICFDNSGSQIYPSFSSTACAIISGINDIRNEEVVFKLNPNPANSSVSISVIESYINCTLTITDITGRRIAETKLTSSNTQLSTEVLPDGLYFVTVSSGSNGSTRKLIITK
ncbi:MAG TPA: T9SS type A sorting domain-containing protein [Chitinophagales bacterium]|nr:T9SS type A sorting domain-containing protein [Chitinophagales bacterium]